MKRPTFLLLTTFLLSSPAFAGELRLTVDLEARELVAAVDGEVVNRYTVSVGKPKHPTPDGQFEIRKVIWNPSWRPPASKWARGKTAKPPGHPENPMKRVKMFFREPDYYIHGTGAEESLGKAESHGCIRMSPEDVTELAKMVMEHGGKPMPDPWYRRIFRSRTTRVVSLTEPVLVRIQRDFEELAD
ncbi:MAG: L,D-transpeptidase [Thermoanaerobaculia bacterium]